MHLLSTLGREGATSRAICAEVGVGAPAIYHHYGDLAGLHKAAIDETFRRVAATYRRSAKAKGPLQGIRDSWTLFMHFAHEEPRMCRVVIQQILAGEPPRAVDGTLRSVARDLANLKVQGRLLYSPDYAAQLLWMAALGALSFTATEQQQDAKTYPVLQESMVELVLNSLFAKPARKAADKRT